jgi:aminopeptidase N
LRIDESTSRFGNLVSPEWWTFLWINEGFAALYEYYLTHITYPGERFLDNFYIDYQRVALEVDANPNIRAMSHYVENSDRIERFES